MSNIPGRLCGHHRHLSSYFWSLSPVSAFSSPWPLPGVEASSSHASQPASKLPSRWAPLCVLAPGSGLSLPSQGCLSVTGCATLVPTPFPGSPRPILSLPEEGHGTSQPLPASCQSSWASVHPSPPAPQPPGLASAAYSGSLHLPIFSGFPSPLSSVCLSSPTLPPFYSDLTLSA